MNKCDETKLLVNIKHLYLNIVTKKKIIIIQIIENEEIDQFHLHEKSNFFELGIKEDFFLKIIEEVHLFWKKFILERNKKFSRYEIFNIYLMTIGFLISTNDNHSNNQIHENVTFELYNKIGEKFLLKEFKFILTLLGSKLNSINKSSTLWFWMKKISIILIFDKIIKGKIVLNEVERLLESLMLSFQFHYANYYAGGFLRWFIDMTQYLIINIKVSNNFKFLCDFKKILLERLNKLCKKKTSDITIWSLLSYMLKSKLKENIDYVLIEYNRLAKNINFLLTENKIKIMEIMNENKLSKNIKSDFTQDLIESINENIIWLVSIDCNHKYIYIQMTDALKTHTKCLKLQKSYSCILDKKKSLSKYHLSELDVQLQKTLNFILSIYDEF